MKKVCSAGVCYVIRMVTDNEEPAGVCYVRVRIELGIQLRVLVFRLADVCLTSHHFDVFAPCIIVWHDSKMIWSAGDQCVSFSNHPLSDL